MTLPKPRLPALPDEEQRFESTLQALNERIARLSVALGVNLAERVQLQQVVHRDAVMFQIHRVSPASIRHRRLLEELRGLLVLRCHLMAQSLPELGLDAIEHAAIDAEQQMLREGFEPGADGFDLLERLLMRPAP